MEKHSNHCCNLKRELTEALFNAGVGNDFFSREGGPGGGFGPRAQGGYQGGGFLDPKIDQF